MFSGLQDTYLAECVPYRFKVNDKGTNRLGALNLRGLKRQGWWR